MVDLDLGFAEFITDEGLVHLKGWTALERLNLRGTKITDTGLEHLAGLTRLKSLDVSFSRISEHGSIT